MQTTIATTATATDNGVEPRQGKVLSSIREAAQATGVPFDYLLAQATQESRLDPEARNRHSSASGLFQFTTTTWLETVKKYGAKHGLDAYADAIKRTSSGRYEVADKGLRKLILDLRKDPEVSALMAGEYAHSNAKTLESKLGRPASSHDLFLAHFLGAGGAVRVLKAMRENPDDTAHGVLPQAARANPDLFTDRQTQEPRSLAALYDAVQAQFSKALGKTPALMRQTPSALAQIRPEPRPDPDQEYIALAELRPVPRPETAESADSAMEVAMATPGSASRPAQPAPADPSRPFATAIQPESPFFPVPLPPAATSQRADSLTMRGLLDAVDEGKKV